MQNKKKIKKLVLYATLAAIIFGAKMIMSFLPNIEPVSLLLAVFTMCFGLESIYIMAIYVLCEVAMYDCDIWTIGYLYIWLILILLVHFVWTHNFKVKVIIPVVAIYGLIFGALYIPVYWALYGWNVAIAWWISGIPYDLLHLGGNLILGMFIPTLYIRLLTLKIYFDF